MTTDGALSLMLDLFVTCARVGGPLLLIALAAGRARPTETPTTSTALVVWQPRQHRR